MNPSKATQRELKELNAALTAVIGAILQKPSRVAGKIVGVGAAKLAAAGVLAGTFSAIGAFGVASTGTAIATLSGAAATTATLYWIGSTVGLGVAAGGAMLTGGAVAVAIPSAIYAKKKLFGRPRTELALAPREQALLYAALRLATASRASDLAGTLPSAEEKRLVAERGIAPLVASLRSTYFNVEQDSQQCAPPPRLVALVAAATPSKRRRKTRPAVREMEKTVERRARSAAVVLAVTLQRLIENPEQEWTVEEAMVLDALRRSKGALKDATPEQLGEYLSGLSAEQFRGVISNVKGIFHEKLVAAAENSDGDGVIAVMPEATNQPGYDLEFIIDDEVGRVVQLKAVASVSHIFEHLERYPGIDILATDEVAALIPGVSSSGFSNSELEDQVRETLMGTYGSNVSQEMVEAASSSLLVGAAFAAGQAIRTGSVGKRELKAALGDIGVGLGTALALEVVLGGA